MWYVNVLNDKLEVECYECYVLTIWYVNAIHKTKFKTKFIGYVLTMWYVNFSIVVKL